MNRRSVPLTAVFFSLVLLYILAYFYRVSLPVIATDLSSEFALGASQLGTVSAALFLAFALTQLPLGPLLDRLGPRPVLLGLGAVTVCGSVLFASARSFEMLVAGRALMGMGTAAVLMGSLKIYASYFPPGRFATLAGLQVALGNLGNLMATVPLAWASGVFGWRASFWLMAALTLVAVLLVGVLVSPGLPPCAPASAPRSFLADWRELATLGDFWCLGLLAFFWYGSYMAIQGLWGGPYLERVLELDPLGSGRMLSMTALGFILGCPLCGYLSDRCFGSRKKVLLVAQFTLVLLLLLFTGPLAGLPSWSLPAVFFSIGLCVSSGPLLYAQVKERFAGSMAATAMASLNFFVMLGAAVIQLLMGRMLNSGAGGVDPAALQQAFFLPAGGLALAWLLYLRVKECPVVESGECL